MKRKLGLVWVFLARLSGCAGSVKQDRGTAVRNVWTELGPGGALIARVMGERSCPALSADDRTILTRARQQATPQFPLPVCEAVIPPGTQRISLDGASLPSWSSHPRRILFLGDTGCNIKKKKNGEVFVQPCNDPEKWPFALVAKSAAAWKPDLVVHVGDYHYREADCPPGNKGCAGSVSGDRWESWQQDFFAPAAPLLRASPWIFVRGNHELCARAGNGWFLLLDPRAPPADCTDASPAYQVPFAGHLFTVIDSADEKNIAAGLAGMKPSSPGRLSWLVLHRPFLTAGADDEASVETKLPRELSAPGAITAVFTGHRHILSLNRFRDGRPPELITGNGGDRLETENKNPSSVRSTLFHDFGFLTLAESAVAGTWDLEEHDRNGAVVRKCRLSEQAGKKTELRCDE